MGINANLVSIANDKKKVDIRVWKRKEKKGKEEKGRKERKKMVVLANNKPQQQKNPCLFCKLCPSPPHYPFF